MDSIPFCICYRDSCIVKIFARGDGFFLENFSSPSKNLKGVYGEWCVITGATDGIGKAFAFEMAKKGLNVLLISRTQSKLEQTKTEIKERYKVEVKILKIDFSTFDSSVRSQVAAVINELEVGILINNVGISYPYPMYFNELSDERVEQMVQLNINTTIWMTRIVLPGMEERKRGAIVNISSAASLIPNPLLTAYSASKAFIDQFSLSLDAEVRSKGIHVQSQCPLFVATKLSKIRNSSMTVPSPTQYARAATAAIGYETVCSPYWSHKFMLWAMSLVRHNFLSNYIKKMHLGIRKKALRKANKTR